MFYQTRADDCEEGHRGFAITLPNGVTIEAAFGESNQCSNKLLKRMPDGWLASSHTPYNSASCEFTAYAKDGTSYTKQVAKVAGVRCDDDTIGFVIPAEFAKLLTAAMSLPPVTPVMP